MSLVTYYLNRRWLKKLCEVHEEPIPEEYLKSEFSKKADLNFVVPLLEQKADKNILLDESIILSKNKVIIGEDLNNIDIGTSNLFSLQNINLGPIQVNKKGLNIDKTPTLKFRGDDVSIFYKEDLIFKDKNISIPLKTIVGNIELNKDRIITNQLDISDLRDDLNNDFYTKGAVDEILTIGFYNKDQSLNLFASKGFVENILINNEGYSKNETDLIFINKRECYDTFLKKNVFSKNMLMDLVLVSQNNEEILKINYLLLELLSDTEAVYCETYQSTRTCGVSMWENDNLSCYKPTYSYLWASNENGDIQSGDLLVSSGTIKGYCCKLNGDAVVTNFVVGKCVLGNGAWEENVKLVYCVLY